MKIDEYGRAVIELPNGTMYFDAIGTEPADDDEEEGIVKVSDTSPEEYETEEKTAVEVWWQPKNSDNAYVIAIIDDGNMLEQDDEMFDAEALHILLPQKYMEIDENTYVPSMCYDTFSFSEEKLIKNEDGTLEIPEDYEIYVRYEGDDAEEDEDDEEE